MRNIRRDAIFASLLAEGWVFGWQKPEIILLWHKGRKESNALQDDLSMGGFGLLILWFCLSCDLKITPNSSFSEH